MLLKISKLSGDEKHHGRQYINTRMIEQVGSASGFPDCTVIILADGSKAFVHKPVEEVVETLIKYDSSLML